MVAFEIPDMTCGRCAGKVTEALKAVDQAARVTIDQALRLVVIESTSARPDVLQAAIEQAGYTPVRAGRQPAEAFDPKPCCGTAR